jgi:hypothetical protein
MNIRTKARPERRDDFSDRFSQFWEGPKVFYPKKEKWYRNTAITPWSRGLLEKLTVSQLVKKFPNFIETGWFITAFTRTRHLSLY